MKIKGAIIVGAHEFREEREYRKLGVKYFILIEPAEKAHTILMHKYRGDSRMIMIGNAAGSSFGKSFLRVETQNDGQSNSLLDPDLHLELHPDITFDGLEKVNVVTLDSMVYAKVRNLDSWYNFLSIDVQGFELEVLKGATGTLKFIDYIHIEVNQVGHDVYKGCANIREVDRFLDLHGFNRKETKWHRSASYGEAFYTRQLPE